MKADGLVSFGTDLENPNFAAVAESVGIRGWSVQRNRRTCPAVAEFLAHDGQRRCSMTGGPAGLPIPRRSRIAQATGFTPWASVPSCPAEVTNWSTSPRSTQPAGCGDAGKTERCTTAHRLHLPIPTAESVDPTHPRWMPSCTNAMEPGSRNASELSQAATSHALARLRKTFDDPLLIRSDANWSPRPKPTGSEADCRGDHAPVGDALQAPHSSTRPPHA